MALYFNNLKILLLSYNGQLRANCLINDPRIILPPVHHFAFIYKEFHLSLYCLGTYFHEHLSQFFTVSKPSSLLLCIT